MPGSGKATVCKVLEERGIPRVVMGDVVREETLRRGLELNPENVGTVMLDLRRRHGQGVIANRVVEKLKMLQQDLVVVDGIRSMAEVKALRAYNPNTILIAVHASPKSRFDRLRRRGRADDPRDWDTFERRDERELGVGIGSAIALADHMIVNEGSMADLRRKALSLAGRISH